MSSAINCDSSSSSSSNIDVKIDAPTPSLHLSADPILHVDSDKNMSENDFVELVGYESDYEIQVNYPHVIRCKRTGKLVSESIGDTGYVQVNLSTTLNHKSCLKHRLIALQFIPNPDNLPIVDHKNKVKTDNRINNLRWVTRSENNENKLGHHGVTYTFVIDLPKNAFEFDHYGKHQFKNYFYYDNTFYFRTNNDEYRVLPIVKNNRTDTVQCKNINGKYIKIFVNKFKKLYAVE